MTNETKTAILCPSCGASIELTAKPCVNASCAHNAAARKPQSNVAPALTQSSNRLNATGDIAAIIATAIQNEPALSQSSIKTKSSDDIATIIATAIQNNPDLADAIKKAVSDIDEGGYIAVPEYIRRWLPAQTLQRLKNESVGFMSFHEDLKRTSTKYRFKVLANELHAQKKMSEHKDFEEYDIRNMFFNKKIAEEMIENYINQIKKYYESLPDRRCKRKTYKRLRVGWLNNGLGIFLHQFNDFINKLQNAYQDVKLSIGASSLSHAVDNFVSLQKQINFEANMCPAFANAYKAAGAYYTAKDLIIFEGCRIYEDGKRLNLEESLSYLDDFLNEVWKLGINQYGYKLMGFLKIFIKENNFDVDEARKEWDKAAAQRKAKRNASKSSRRSR